MNFTRGNKKLNPSNLTLDEIRSKLSGLHFAKEMLSKNELSVLLLAESLLRYIDDEENKDICKICGKEGYPLNTETGTHNLCENLKLQNKTTDWYFCSVCFGSGKIRSENRVQFCYNCNGLGYMLMGMDGKLFADKGDLLIGRKKMDLKENKNDRL